MISLDGFRGVIQRSSSLGPHTTWRVGGPAEIFVVPKDLEDLMYLLQFVRANSTPLFILGRGSNVLIDDNGLPGITMSLGPAFQQFEYTNEHLLVGASLPMPTLAQRTAKLGFAGFEHLIGIPGSVGAGIVINAGKGTDNATDMSSVLNSVTYINSDLEVIEEPVQNLCLGYRTSKLKDSHSIVVSAKFSLAHRDDPLAVQERIRSILAERRAKFPLNFPNVGSVFRRPAGYPPAGWLIETSGLKGLRVGDAQISPQHANFIINLGHATARDIRNLMTQICELVYLTHKVMLEPEVVFMPEQRNW